MSKHTDGPWTLTNGLQLFDEDYIRKRGEDNLKIYWQVSAGKGFLDDDGFGFSFTSHANEADARLIAAAPELLEALEELSGIVQGLLDGDDCQNSIDSFTLQPARAAIAKAKGET